MTEWSSYIKFSNWQNYIITYIFRLPVPVRWKVLDNMMH